jgi:hypothetical protein
MSDSGIVRTSPKTNRRPQTHTLALWRAIAEVAAEFDQMSVRQLYYQLVSRGVVPKTETAYERLADAWVQMRRVGEVPYHEIAGVLRGEGTMPKTADGFVRRFKAEIVQHRQELAQGERHAA